jgi:hypothetical protein
MGRQPSLAYEKGETFAVTGRALTRKTGMWMIRVEPCEPERLNAQIAELLDSVAASSETWRKLHEQFEIDVFCGLFLDGGNEGVSLEPAILSALAERNLTIGFDIYGPSPEDDKRRDEV